MQPKVSPYTFPLFKREPPKAEDILNIVSRITKVEIKEIAGQCRAGDRPKARHLFCYLTRKHTFLYLSQIADFIGNRDHTTIRNSIFIAIQLIEADPVFKKWHEQAEKEIDGSFVRIDHMAKKVEMSDKAYILKKRLVFDNIEEEDEPRSTITRPKAVYSNPQFIY